MVNRVVAEEEYDNRRRGMRFLVKATIPTEAGNELVRDPQFSKRLEGLLSDIRPEAAYFAVEGGQRTIYLIANFKENSQLPSIAEPLWLSLKARVEFIPVMDQADMTKATPSIAQAAKAYGGNSSPAKRRARVLV